MLFLFTILLNLVVIDASHYRGGTVSWRHVRSYDGDIQEIEVYFRLGWRRDFSGPQCDDSYIASQVPIYNYGNWEIDSGQAHGISRHSVEVKCTTFDSSQNWAYGFNSFYANVSEINSFNIRFSGFAWISPLLLGGGGWSIEALNDEPGNRSDTGIFNRPPSTFSAPIVRVQRGCPSDIRITYNDDDNDNVFCRLANRTSECGGVCGLYGSFSLNQTTCTIHYDGSGGIGLAPVALMLEDFPTQTILVGNITTTPSDHLSQVPLQFLVEIVTTTNCNVRPSFPSASIPEGATFVLPESGVFNETIYAYPSAPGIRITLFIILGPLGVQKSSIFYIGNNTFIAHVTWRPSQDQSGRHDVCYYAVDEDGKNSEQRCFRITVAEIANSCEVDNGGCSDICIPLNGTNICNCSNPCWELDSHGKTCVPRTNISCSGNEVQIFVDKCSTDKTIVAGTSHHYFSNPHCQSVEGSEGYEIYFTPDQCGTGLELSATGVKYNVYMWTWENFDDDFEGNSVVVRGEWRIVRLSCYLPSTLNLTASFLPLPALNEEIVPETLVIDGLGSFLLYFDFYRSSSFLSSYTRSEYPLSVALHENIYFALRAEGRTGLELFVERCVAMSTPTLTPDTLTYALIDNGCIVDPTTTFYSSANTMESRFSFQAFEFESNLLLSRSNSAAFINCQIVMCDIANNSTRCKQGCVGGSRRRRSSGADPRAGNDIDDDDDSDVTPVPQSPPSEITRQIKFIFPDENPPTTSGENIKWIMIGVGGLILLLALYLVYRIVLAKRGNTAHKNSTVQAELNQSFDFESKL